MSTNNNIRNFCIIAHIDHGKSTLADRLLEFTHTVSSRDMKNQILDSMDLERERGITIKLTPVRMEYSPNFQLPITNFQSNHNDRISKLKNENCKLKIADSKFILNLIDTPGHVDFTYEVSRSLAAVEGAILEQNLTIIPVINKIDMPIANVAKTREEIINLIGCKPEEILLASGKTGQGVEEILQNIISRIPSPMDNANKPPRALIFDSQFNEYKGVVTAVRMVDGELTKGEKIYLMSTHAKAEVLELGYYTPKFKPSEKIYNGEIGYIVTGIKEPGIASVGDTVASFGDSTESFPGYESAKPVVWASVYPENQDHFAGLKQALSRLQLSDSAFSFE